MAALRRELQQLRRELLGWETGDDLVERLPHLPAGDDACTEGIAGPAAAEATTCEGLGEVVCGDGEACDVASDWSLGPCCGAGVGEGKCRCADVQRVECVSVCPGGALCECGETTGGAECAGGGGGTVLRGGDDESAEVCVGWVDED